VGRRGYSFVSPDLDQEGYSALEIEAVRALGPLGYLWLALWWPYAKLIPHRSFWSHGPLVGTAGRLLWLFLVCPVLVGLAAGAGLVLFKVLAREPTSLVEGIVAALRVRAALRPPDFRLPFWQGAVAGLAVSDAAHGGMDVPKRRQVRRHSH
jgi:uncharacterized metal-binding protein